MTDVDLARLLTEAAEQLERRYAASVYAGLLRQAAHRIRNGPSATKPGCCTGCAAQLTGRQRQWCSERCRRRART